MKKKIIGFLAVCFVAVLFLVSCTKKYTVEFDVDGGYVVESVQVTEGELLTAPTTTKDKMTFLGWYADIDLIEEFDFTKPVTGNMTLYAKWGVTLSFDSKGGTAAQAIVGEALKPVEKLPTPTRKGYVFAGWYKEEALTNEQTVVLPATNATVYAKWLVKDDTTALDLSSLAIQDPGTYKYTLAENGDQTYQVTEPVLKMNKANGEWAATWSEVKGSAIKNMKNLTVEVKGTAGQQLLIKLNDQGGACEKWVDMDGNVQTVTFAFPEFTLNENGTALAFMANAGKNEASGEYVVTKVLFDNGETADDKKQTVDLLKSGWACGAEYTIESYVGTDTYSFVKTYINHDVQDYNAIIMDIVGTKGCKILLKVEQGGIEAPYEQSFEMTGEAQTITWILDKKFLTKNGGEMFLFFLNPGNTGNTYLDEAGKPHQFEQTAQVTIKSVGLYKLVAEGSQNKESSIFFNENGGSAVETITNTIGATVTAPEAPTKEGFNFVGWYTDATFTNEYTFDKMPEETIELYAKWEKAVVDPKSVDMLEDTFVPNAVCTVTQENGTLVVKKNSGSPYESAESTLKVKDILTGMSVLKVEFQGTKGQKVIFKVGNHWECEKAVDLTGEVQYIEYEFDATKLPAENKALIIMPGAHGDGESGNLTITHLEFANYRSKENLLQDTFVPNAVCTVTQENGTLVVKKNSGSPYESAESTLKVSDLPANFSVLKVEFQGTEGQKVIFKVGNHWECEKAVDLTGEVQYIEYVFDYTKLPKDNKALVIMPGAHGDGESGNLTITRLEFANEYDHVDVKAGWVENDKDSYVISNENGVLKVKKNDTWTDGTNTPGTEWCFAKNTITVEEGKYTTLVINFTGSVAGQEIIFALGAVEAKPFTTGEAQTVEIKVEGTIANNTLLKIFANAGKVGSCELVITDMYLK